MWGYTVLAPEYQALSDGCMGSMWRSRAHLALWERASPLPQDRRRAAAEPRQRPGCSALSTLAAPATLAFTSPRMDPILTFALLAAAAFAAGVLNAIASAGKVRKVPPIAANATSALPR